MKGIETKLKVLSFSLNNIDKNRIINSSVNNNSGNKIEKGRLNKKYK